MDFRGQVDTCGNARPAGQRLIHRRADLALPGAQSTSPLQTRYVSVGFMYYEGLLRLLAAGVTLPRVHAGDSQCHAVEAYLGFLAHELISRRSQKNDDGADRLIARKDIVDALEQGRTRLAVRLKLTYAQRDQLVDDASGDGLDAVLCLVQADWASTRPKGGPPPAMDTVEGWIVTA